MAVYLINYHRRARRERWDGKEMGKNLGGLCGLSGEIVAILLGQRPPVRASFLDNLAARG